MIIQTSYQTHFYEGVANSTNTRQRTESTKANNAGTERASDHVSISSAGKTMATYEQSSAAFKTPAQASLLQAASSDKGSAEKIAYDMAYGTSNIIYSSVYDTDASGRPNKLASSGRIIDRDFVDRFGQEASKVDAQRQAIYDSEKAKGTAPVQIINMMMDFTAAQSSDYLEATGWGWSNGVNVIRP